MTNKWILNDLNLYLDSDDYYDIRFDSTQCSPVDVWWIPRTRSLKRAREGSATLATAPSSILLSMHLLWTNERCDERNTAHIQKDQRLLRVELRGCGGIRKGGVYHHHNHHHDIMRWRRRRWRGLSASQQCFNSRLSLVPPTTATPFHQVSILYESNSSRTNLIGCKFSLSSCTCSRVQKILKTDSTRP